VTYAGEKIAYGEERKTELIDPAHSAFHALRGKRNVSPVAKEERFAQPPSDPVGDRHSERRTRKAHSSREGEVHPAVVREHPREGEREVTRKGEGNVLPKEAEKQECVPIAGKPFEQRKKSSRTRTLAS